MIHHSSSVSVAASRTIRALQTATVAGAFALIGVACTNSGFESQPVEHDSSTSSTAADGTPGFDTGAGDELALVADALYDEPDLVATGLEEEISETAAEVPEDEPIAAGPEDTADVPQVAVGSGESALCATVQIGRDALSDGVDELLVIQQELLSGQADLIEDGELRTLLETIGSSAPADAALFGAALRRCEALGFQP